jgi:major membrane immunogen (membrane-anchored lipoprotein)
MTLSELFISIANYFHKYPCVGNVYTYQRKRERTKSQDDDDEAEDEDDEDDVEDEDENSGYSNKVAKARMCNHVKIFSGV